MLPAHTSSILQSFCQPITARHIANESSHALVQSLLPCRMWRCLVL